MQEQERTITEAQCIGEPFKGTHGDLYPFVVTLENGQKVFANSNSDKPWWASGGKVVVKFKGSQTKSGMEKVGFGKVEGDERKSPPPAKRYDGPKAKTKEDIISSSCCHYVLPAVNLEIERARKEQVFDWERVRKNIVNIHKAKELAVQDIMQPETEPDPQKHQHTAVAGDEAEEIPF